MKISVITPSLNTGAHIERAIKSVLEQAYENFEHIIIDGLSTDNTIEILQQYPHLIWTSEADSGQSNAMNKGFAMATGDIIVYLNADDYFLPKAFDTILPFFQKGEKFVVGDANIVLLDGQTVRVTPKVSHESILYHWVDWTPIQEGRVASSFPNNPVQYFYLRKVQEKFPFNEDNHFTMDLEFLMYASSYYDFYKIDDILGVYTLYEDAKSIVASNDIENYWTFENFSYIDNLIENWAQEKKRSFKNEQQKGYIRRALNQYRNKMNKELKQKDEQLHSKQELIEALNKKIIDLHQMVSSKNPLNTIRAIRFIKKHYKDTL
ncbi:MAG: glycosyltransferase family 2 protein [Sulfurovaceae bacterium]